MGIIGLIGENVCRCSRDTGMMSRHPYGNKLPKDPVVREVPLVRSRGETERRREQTTNRLATNASWRLRGGGRMRGRSHPLTGTPAPASAGPVEKKAEALP